MTEQRNLVLAFTLSALVMVGYFFLYSKPTADRIKAEKAAAQTYEQQVAVSEAAPEIVLKDRNDLISGATQTGGRISIDTPSLKGSLSLDGFRLDDLELKNYNAYTFSEKKRAGQSVITGISDENVIMFSPEGSGNAAYVFDGWARAGETAANAKWSLLEGESLTPESPVVLGYEGSGFTVKRIVSVDDKYLVSLDDQVTNTSGGELTLTRQGASRQHGLPQNLTNFFILQEGPIAILDNKLVDMKYKKLGKKGRVQNSGESGWVGLTDKYWLAAAIAPQDKPMTATFEMKNYNGADVYEAGYALAPMTLSAGATIESKGYFYTGAKRRELLNAYMKTEGIARMDMAIDWGFLGPLTRPMSWALSYFGKLTGNFGVGILIITLILKIILFPLNNKAYASQAKMKAVQPKMKKMQELYKDDRAKLQQEMMAMYKKEGVNPVGGCLPMIPQIFIFFALYKSLFINIDMRQAPFVGWIQDLSQKDPLSVLNGFGLLPWDGVPIAFLSFFAIGPLALMYGASMASMQTLSAPAGDPMQRKIFQLMPLFFMFILAPFAAGLLVYWVWNNILSYFQQYYITRKFGVETPFDKFFARLFGRSKNTAE